MNFQVSPYFLIIENADGLKRLYEESLGAKHCISNVSRIDRQISNLISIKRFK